MTTMTPPPQTLPERVNANIRAELARAGTRPADVADALEVSLESVRRRLRGAQPWQLDELGVVAALVGVEPSDLVT